MGTPSLSCNTDALSNTPLVDSDDEGPQSSMWVRQEGHTSSELPSDFLEPLSPGVEVISPLPPLPTRSHGSQQQSSTHDSRKFWKSGDFTGSYEGATFATEGMDHARVHPKFLHSNATSHKWVLGAIAELLDNAVDEIRNGATYVKVDVMQSPRNGEPMLVIEDDGGGMDPDCMRRCMSLGYSAKSKLSNTIGQYGNGFKTSTMRLGADVIVFSRSGVSKPSESIGMMSYTFLTSTGQNDIVVPIVDFQMEAFGIRKLIRSTVDDWVESMDAIEKWSPYSSQAELVNQFKSMPHHQGTRVIIYNLWEDEEGLPELDLTTDPTDIQIRSTSRSEKNLKMATCYPSCWHYLTYRHSLRSYISILYLRLPSRFRIFLRGKPVEHHSLRNEMMLVEEVTYRPKDVGHSKAVVTLGFVKDAKEHLDISGFNVYHKNRLIKPFWRIWNPSDTRGRGIIGILEANFVEPAHDKQGFERTIVLSRLEARLVEMQKSYFSKNCHMIGYNNASLKRRVRSNPKENDGTATNSGKMESGHRDARYLAVSDSAASNVHGAANGGGDVSLAQGINGKESETLRVSSALMMLPLQDACVNPARHEMQEQDVLFSSMHTIPSGIGKSNSVVFGRQCCTHVSQQVGSLVKAEGYMQDAILNTAGLDSHTLYSPVSSDISLNNLQKLSSVPASLDLQRLCPPSSVGVVPFVIDLDSPETEQKCDEAAFEIENCEASRPTARDSSSESVLLMTGTNACEGALPLRERSDDVAMCPEEAPPERLGIKSCGQLSNDAASLDKVVCTNQVEARAGNVGMERCAELSNIVTTANESPSAMCITGFKDSPRLQIEDDKGTHNIGSFLLGKTVQVNAHYQNTTSSNTGDVEASDPLRLSIASEDLVSATFELDDLFNSIITPQDEVRPHSPQPVKASDAVVTSPVVNMDLTLPDILENATVENELLLLSNLSETMNRSDTTVGIVKHDSDRMVHENIPNDCQLHCEDVVKESASVQLSSEKGIQQVARVLPDIDAATSNVEEHGDVCLLDKQTLVENDEGHISAPFVDQLPTMPATSVPRSFCLEQEDRCTLTSQCVIQDADTSNNDRACIQKNMARVSQEPRNIYSQSATLGSIQASNQALQQDLVIVHDMATAVIATRDVSTSSCGDFSHENATSKVLVTKLEIESLQQSIEEVAAETDGIRKQLQQQRQLQDLDMRNLSMELERALSRLEELKR